MSDLASAPSDGASEVTSAPAAETSAPAPAPSAREALERAFSVGMTGASLHHPQSLPRNATKAGGLPKLRAQAAMPRPLPRPQKSNHHPRRRAIRAAAAAAPLAAPTRFSKAAQDAWAQAPEAVRVETERALNELTQGLEKYKGAAEAFEPLRRFDDMAKQGGTTLPAAVEAYVNMENLLRSNPVEGLREVCKNIGVDPAQMAAALAGTGAAPAGGDTSEVASLKAELAALRGELGGVSKTIQEQQAERVRANVEQFAQANPRFDELSSTIAELLSTGFAKDLPDAYAKADRLNPAAAAPAAAQTAQAAPA